MTRLKLVLVDENTTIELKGPEEEVYKTYEDLRKELEETGTNFMFFRRERFRWVRMYTINDIPSK